MPTTIIHEASEVVDYSTILSHAFPGLQCKHNHAPCLGNTWPEAALHTWDAKIRRTLARPWPLRTWPEAVRATPGQRPCAQLQPTTNTWPEAVSPSGLAVQAFAPENLEAGHLGWWGSGPGLGNAWPDAVRQLWDKKKKTPYPGPKPLRRIRARSRCAQYLTRSRCVELWPEAAAPSTCPEAARATPCQRPCAQPPPTTNAWPEAVSLSGLAVQAPGHGAVLHLAHGPLQRRGRTGQAPCSTWPEAVLQQLRNPNAGITLCFQPWCVVRQTTKSAPRRGRTGQRPCSNSRI